MKVSNFALREGMIADTLVRLLPHSSSSFVADPRRSSLKHLSKRFNLQNHYVRRPPYHLTPFVLCPAAALSSSGVSHHG